MIAPTKVAEIRGLLAAGTCSYRKIAAATRISRSTIQAIALGRRTDYSLIRRRDLELFPELGPVVRCPGCGGRVHWPCRLCHVRSLRVASAARRPRSASLGENRPTDR